MNALGAILEFFRSMACQVCQASWQCQLVVVLHPIVFWHALLSTVVLCRSTHKSPAGILLGDHGTLKGLILVLRARHAFTPWAGTVQACADHVLQMPHLCCSCGVAGILTNSAACIIIRQLVRQLLSSYRPVHDSCWCLLHCDTDSR